ncbi:hypothetical protein CALCODRAFT_480525 [Calocera cornea HHB12733]|uniref:Uncharacterized protein n=1 Tax=Calocera cornea HHB12733 TaxID=1353952 RepID=A0A165IIT1_9BASI|nr:hypothetical protein CALCODRAFT_480525 [Calocera cornea HHB12733]
MDSGHQNEKAGHKEPNELICDRDRDHGSQAQIRASEVLCLVTKDSIHFNNHTHIDTGTTVSSNPAEVTIPTQQTIGLHIDVVRHPGPSSEPNTPISISPTRAERDIDLETVDNGSDAFSLDSLASLTGSPISPPTTPKRNNGKNAPSGSRRHSIPIVSAERAVTRQTSDISSSTITPPETPETRDKDALRAETRFSGSPVGDNAGARVVPQDGSPRMRPAMPSPAGSDRSSSSDVDSIKCDDEPPLPPPRRLIFNAGLPQSTYISKRRTPSLPTIPQPDTVPRKPKRIVFNTNETPATYVSKNRAPTRKPSHKQSKHVIHYVTQADADAANKALAGRNALLAAQVKRDAYASGMAAADAWFEQGISYFTRRGYTEADALSRLSSTIKKDQSPPGSENPSVALASGAVATDTSGLRIRAAGTVPTQDSGGRW